MTALPKLYTESEAADRLRVCSRTLRKARQTGDLPFVRIGRSIRYSDSDLAQFIERSRECLSTAAKAPRSGNTTSRSTVSDFAEALAKRESARRRR